MQAAFDADDPAGPDRPIATGWTSCSTAISARARRGSPSLVAEVAAACRAEGAELVFLDASGAAQGLRDGPARGRPAPEIAWQMGVDVAPVARAAGGIGAIAYAADPARVALDLDAYRAAAGPDVALEAVLRPARPDCTDAANLAAKLAICRERGVRAAGFYHYGLAPTSAIDRVGAALGSGSSTGRSGLGSRDSTSSSSAISPRPASSPPSTRSTSPVMNEASSEARNATAAATSSGVPMRPSGYQRARRSSRSGSSARRWAHASVRTVPGATALQRMPCRP